jgi:hypothetical protein
MYRVVTDLRDALKAEKVQFVEEYEKKETPAPEESKPETQEVPKESDSQ